MFLWHSPERKRIESIQISTGENESKAGKKSWNFGVAETSKIQRENPESFDASFLRKSFERIQVFRSKETQILSGRCYRTICNGNATDKMKRKRNRNDGSFQRVLERKNCGNTLKTSATLSLEKTVGKC